MEKAVSFLASWYIWKEMGSILRSSLTSQGLVPAGQCESVGHNLPSSGLLGEMTPGSPGSLITLITSGFLGPGHLQLGRQPEAM